MASTVLLYGIDILFHPVSPALSELFQKFAASALFFGAAALCLGRGQRSREERSVWWLFALAMLLWGTGAVYFWTAVWGREVIPYPSIADGFWLAFYVPVYVALYVLLRKRAGSAARSVWLDAVVAGLGVGGAGAALGFQTVLDHNEGPMLGVATNLAYPIGDLGLLALVVAAVTVVGLSGSRTWLLVAGAFALFAVTDSIYLIQVAEGTFAMDGLINLGWPLAALLVGLAASLPKERKRTNARQQTMAIIPVGFAFTAMALLVVDHFVYMNPLALGLAAASLLVILVRLYLTVRENTSLLARSRQDAATDPLTGLGNRRHLSGDLAAELGALDSARPLMLTLFDLDGFKLYNDTFGQVAGDQLLARLGTRLSAVVQGHGVAYRTGGDEFCVLWNRSETGHAAAITEAVAALSEHGEGFAIGCSYGSVLLPNEATDPIEAERIADARMYARKASGRTSAGRQSSDVLLRALNERNVGLVLHLGSVAELACATAERLGVPEPDLETVRQTALLHDVGKVAIPDEILNRPGALDEPEWAFMKRHTLIGERIISAAPALAAVARSVRSTHEHYAGGGYPDGLVGDEIPLNARIVAVCDAYDAMITKRPYQPARTKSEAITELRRCAGTQFDPDVAEAFVTALEASATKEMSSPTRAPASQASVGADRATPAHREPAAV